MSAVNKDGYANSIYTIAVSAVSAYGGQVGYAEQGCCIVVCAPSSGPGYGMVLTDVHGTGGYTSGNYTTGFGYTSAAAPQVSGVVALMLEANPGLGWRDVQEVLLATARVTDPSHPDWSTNGAGVAFNHWYGAGLEMEKVFVPFLLIAKKRYAAVVHEPDRQGVVREDKIEAKGVELVRRDNCPFAKRVYEQVLMPILRQSDPARAVDNLRDRMRELVVRAVRVQGVDALRVEHNVLARLARKDPLQHPDALGARLHRLAHLEHISTARGAAEAVHQVGFARAVLAGAREHAQRAFEGRQPRDGRLVHLVRALLAAGDEGDDLSVGVVVEEGRHRPPG